MINNRIRTIVSTAAGSTLVASVLGLAALGFSGAANAAPAQAPQANATLANAPQFGSACHYYHNGRQVTLPCGSHPRMNY